MTLTEYLAAFRDAGYAWRLGYTPNPPGEPPTEGPDTRPRYWLMLLDGSVVADVLVWGNSELAACEAAAATAREML